MTKPTPPKSITIHRAAHNATNPYASVNRETTQDKALSYAALGMLAYLLSKPDDWRVQLADLERADSGRAHVRSIVKELIKAGHLVYVKARNKRGYFASYYEVYETPGMAISTPASPDAASPDAASPDAASPDAASPQSGNPPAVNPPLQIRDLEKLERQITEQEKKRQPQRARVSTQAREGKREGEKRAVGSHIPEKIRAAGQGKDSPLPPVSAPPPTPPALPPLSYATVSQPPRPNAFGLFEQMCPGGLTLIVGQAIRDALADFGDGMVEAAIREAALSNGRSWKFVRAILDTCHREGRLPGSPRASPVWVGGTGNGAGRSSMPVPIAPDVDPEAQAAWEAIRDTIYVGV